MNDQESAIEQLRETISTLAANLEVCIIYPRGFLFKDKQAETTSQKGVSLKVKVNMVCYKLHVFPRMHRSVH